MNAQEYAIKLTAETAAFRKGLAQCRTEVDALYKALNKTEKEHAQTTVQVHKEAYSEVTKTLNNTKDANKVIVAQMMSDTKKGLEDSKAANKQASDEKKLQLQKELIDYKQSIKEKNDAAKKEAKEEADLAKKAAKEQIEADRQAAKERSKISEELIHNLEHATKHFEHQSLETAEAVEKGTEKHGILTIAHTKKMYDEQIKLAKAYIEKQKAIIAIQIEKANGDAEKIAKAQNTGATRIAQKQQQIARLTTKSNEAVIEGIEKYQKKASQAALVMGQGLSGVFEQGVGKGIGKLAANVGSLFGPLGQVAGEAVEFIMEGVEKFAPKTMEAFENLFKSASTKMAETGKEAKELGEQIENIGKTQVSIKLAIEGGDLESWNKAIEDINKSIEKVPEEAQPAADLIKEMLNQPGGPTVANLKQIDGLMGTIKETAQANMLAKQFEQGEQSLGNFQEKLHNLLVQSNEAEGDAAKQDIIRQQVQAQITQSATERIPYLIAEAKGHGEILSVEEARLLATKEMGEAALKASELTVAGVYAGQAAYDGMFDSIKQGTADAASNMNDMAKSQAESEQITREMNSGLEKQNQETASLVDDAIKYGDAVDGNNEREKEALKIKKENMIALKGAIDAQIAALRVFIAAQGESIQAEEARKKAAEAVSEQEKITADIMKAQKEGVAYAGPTKAADAKTGYNVAGAEEKLKKLEAQSAALEKGIKGIDKEIDNFGKTVKKGHAAHQKKIKEDTSAAKDEAKQRLDALKEKLKADEDANKARLEEAAKIRADKEARAKAEEELRKHITEYSKKLNDEIKQFGDTMLAEMGGFVKEYITPFQEAMLNASEIVGKFNKTIDTTIEDANAAHQQSVELGNKIAAKEAELAQLGGAVENIGGVHAKARTPLSPSIPTLKPAAQGGTEENEAIALSQVESMPAVGGYAENAASTKSAIQGMQAATNATLSYAEALEKAQKIIKGEIDNHQQINEVLKALGFAEVTKNYKKAVQSALDEIDKKSKQEQPQGTKSGQILVKEQTEEEKAIAESTKRKQDAIDADVKRRKDELEKDIKALKDQKNTLESDAALKKAAAKKQEELTPIAEQNALLADLNEIIKQRKEILALQEQSNKEEDPTKYAQLRKEINDRELTYLNELIENNIDEQTVEDNILALKKQITDNTELTSKLTQRQLADINATQRAVDAVNAIKKQSNKIDDESRVHQLELFELQKKHATEERQAKAKEGLTKVQGENENYKQSKLSDIQKLANAQNEALKILNEAYNAHIVDLEQENKLRKEINKQYDEQIQKIKKTESDTAFKSMIDAARESFDELENAIEKGFGENLDKAGDHLAHFFDLFKEGAKHSTNDILAASIQLTTGLSESIAGITKKGASGQAGEAVGATGDIMKKIGMALLNSPVPPLQTIGAILLVSGMITSIIGKIMGHTKTLSEKAQDRANHEMAIVEGYKAQLSLLDDMVKLGDKGVDTAQKQLDFIRQQHAELVAQSGVAANLANESNQQLARDKARLEVLKAQNQEAVKGESDTLSRSDKRKWLAAQGIQATIFNTNRLYDEQVEKLKAAGIDIDSQLNSIQTELDYREKELGEIQKINEELKTTLDLQIRIGESNDQWALSMSKIQSELTNATQGLGSAFDQVFTNAEEAYKYISDPSHLEGISDSQKALVSSFMEAYNAIASIYNSHLQSVDTANDAVISGLEAEYSLMKRNGAAQTELDAKQADIDKAKESKLKNDIDLTDQEYNRVKNMAGMHDYANSLLVKRNNYQKEYNDLVDQANKNAQKSNALLVEAIRLYQQQLAAARKSGNYSQLDPNAVYAAAIKGGLDPKEAQRIVDELPKREQGGPVTQGLYHLHDNEWVLNSKAVAKYGTDFMERLNNLAVPVQKSPHIQYLTQSLTNRSNANNTSQSIQVHIANTFNHPIAPKQAYDLINKDLERQVVGIVQRNIDNGKLNPSR